MPVKRFHTEAGCLTGWIQTPSDTSTVLYFCVTVSPHHTSMVTVSRWYFGSLARFTFSVRVCHTRTYKITFVLVQASTEMIQNLFTKCGNQYLCAVVCFWLQFLHCRYLFQEIRFLHSRLRTAPLEYGFWMRQNHLKTHSKSLEGKKDKKNI